MVSTSARGDGFRQRTAGRARLLGNPRAAAIFLFPWTRVAVPTPRPSMGVSAWELGHGWEKGWRLGEGRSAGEVTQTGLGRPSRRRRRRNCRHPFSCVPFSFPWKGKQVVLILSSPRFSCVSFFPFPFFRTIWFVGVGRRTWIIGFVEMDFVCYLHGWIFVSCMSCVGEEREWERHFVMAFAM